jgi:hypothetical protein
MRLSCRDLPAATRMFASLFSLEDFARQIICCIRGLLPFHTPTPSKMAELTHVIRSLATGRPQMLLSGRQQPRVGLDLAGRSQVPWHICPPAHRGGLLLHGPISCDVLTGCGLHLSCDRGVSGFKIVVVVTLLIAPSSPCVVFPWLF